MEIVGAVEAVGMNWVALATTAGEAALAALVVVVLLVRRRRARLAAQP
jgi:MYXO-CTERM domain-containing protein